MKKEWKIDVPVLLIFFARPDTLEKVFAAIKEARPSKLLLWQDGPRENRPDDIENIEKCRKIVEDIDWDCEVHKVYNEKNFGCDPSTFYADRWAFSIVDKCIVLEDDQMPSQSYFRYCKELLDKYENDTRISHICGYNTFANAEWCEDDYLFAHIGTGAWASWRRVAENWDSEYTCLEKENVMYNLKKQYGKKSNLWMNYANRHKNSGKAHWESIIGMNAHLQSQFVIIPKRNLVKNLGISENATHASVSDLDLIPKKDRMIYLNDAQEIEFPLKHPKYVLLDAKYDKMREKENNPSKLRKILKKAEFAYNLVKKGEFSLIFKTVKKKI